MSQDGSEVHFKIKPTTPMKKLMGAYCARASVSAASMRFLYDGTRLKEDATAQDMGIEDGDIIDAMLNQTGGMQGWD